MSQILFANNATSTLAGGISSVATAANLAAGSGVLFPAPISGQYFCMTFTDSATGLLNEIVHVTNVTGDVVTIVRAQEGTDALAWSAGDLADNLVTAGSLAAFQQTSLAARTITAAGPQAILTSDVNVFVNQTVAAAITLMMPSSPSANQEVTIFDDKGDAAANNITVNGNGNTINNFPSNIFTLNQDYQSTTFVWNATGTAWRIKNYP